MSAETAYRRFHEDLAREFPEFVRTQRKEVTRSFSEYLIGRPCEACNQALPLKGPTALFWRFRQSQRELTTKQLRIEIPSDKVPAQADVRSFFANRCGDARVDIFLTEEHWHVARNWGSGTGDELYDQLRPGRDDAVKLREWAMHTMCDALLLLHT